MAANELNRPGSFDILISKNFPHIQEKIFFSLDYKTYKACMEVNGSWKELLTSERYITKGKSVFRDDILKDEEKLSTAVTDNNTDQAKRLLASGMVDVNRRCGVYPHQRPLHDAASSGNVEMTELLIKSGADLGKTDDYGKTPLHLASTHGHAEVVLLLLEHGADPNVAVAWEGTTLHAVARNRNTDVALILLGHGADPNVANERGRTPLHIAAMYHHYDFVSYLLVHGADPNAVDNRGQTPKTMFEQYDWKGWVDQIQACQRLRNSRICVIRLLKRK